MLNRGIFRDINHRKDANGDLLQTVNYESIRRGEDLKRVNLDGRLCPSLYLSLLKSYSIFR